ncbi:hypothetical protein DM860_010871 [Cuscuta australis]|uniref:Pectinesterase inhibitor domain-containing protein n=1 Tax=Cuscuta australis TaxID=267555 RepID=A0A328E439_9ASTE|nr:hypothetical protein DM860_010871 [Cuscuta australis]
MSSKALLIFHFLAFSLLFTSSSSSSYVQSASASAGAHDTDFIRKSCNMTEYPRLCFTSLSSRAESIRADPELLAHAALSVALKTARSTEAALTRMARRRGLTRRETGAMRDCVEQLGDSVDQLGESLDDMRQLGGRRRGDFGLVMNDIETWVSAALTDEDTCTEGFAGERSRGGVKAAVRGRIVNVAHLTSNALALINHVAQRHR